MFRIHYLIFTLSLALLWPSPAVAGSAGVQAAEDMDFYDRGSPLPAKVELGRKLFFDKILSGNLNISCASCHHPLAGTGDGLSLPVGEGGNGLAVTRDTGHGIHSVPERVPRNAPAIFNLGAREFNRMFHDGRIEEDLSESSGFRSPALGQLPPGLDNVLAAQAMFPVTSGTEMAGQPGENPQANAAHENRLAGVDGVWNLIADRLRALPEYVNLFREAFPAEVQQAADIDYVLAANAIAAFEAVAWRFDNSPFDRYLRGDRHAMSNQARAGMNLFYGKAGCSHCHSGIFQTDQAFHAIAMPQIGPGKGDNLEGYEDGRDDFGRERVSGRFQDRFRFRTPSLRNLALSAPYGHSGAFGSLDEVVRHHLDAESSLHSYDRTQVSLPPNDELDALDFVVMDDPVRRTAIADANELMPVNLKNREIDELIAFLHALSDPAAFDMRRDVPFSVPSGLPIWD